MRDFDMGLVVISLSVSLMVCGFGVGPLVWSPIVRVTSCFRQKRFADLTSLERDYRPPTRLDSTDYHLRYLHYSLCGRTKHSTGL